MIFHFFLLNLTAVSLLRVLEQVTCEHCWVYTFIYSPVFIQMAYSVSLHIKLLNCMKLFTVEEISYNKSCGWKSSVDTLQIPEIRRETVMKILLYQSTNHIDYYYILEHHTCINSKELFLMKTLNK